MSSLIDDLQDPAALPDETETVRVVQTHISIVFIGDEFVYKIKKPVDFGFLDFSTLDKREYYCRQEVALNRRLSRDIYLDVLPVIYGEKGYSLTGGRGEVAEYAVKMRRIPEHMLMKSVFDRGELEDRQVEEIAEMLAEFHKTAERNSEIDSFGEPDRFKVNTDENFEQVQKYVGSTVDEKEYRALYKWTEAFFNSKRDLFFDRIGNGRIRDCHGDLHMEHVCFTKPLSIIDCIEFNDRFRYSDTLADIAFLLMDLEYHGGWDRAASLWNKYKAFAEEREVDDLLVFYKIYRAFVRGKVISFQVDDEAIGPEEKDKAAVTAKRYFQLAYSYIK